MHSARSLWPRSSPWPLRTPADPAVRHRPLLTTIDLFVDAAVAAMARHVSIRFAGRVCGGAIRPIRLPIRLPTRLPHSLWSPALRCPGRLVFPGAVLLPTVVSFVRTAPASSATGRGRLIVRFCSLLFVSFGFFARPQRNAINMHHMHHQYRRHWQRPLRRRSGPDVFPLPSPLGRHSRPTAVR